MRHDSRDKNNHYGIDYFRCNYSFIRGYIMSLEKDLLDLARDIFDVIQLGAIVLDMQKGKQNAEGLIEQIDYNPEDYNE